MYCVSSDKVVRKRDIHVNALAFLNSCHIFTLIVVAELNVLPGYFINWLIEYLRYYIWTVAAVWTWLIQRILHVLFHRFGYITRFSYVMIGIGILCNPLVPLLTVRCILRWSVHKACPLIIKMLTPAKRKITNYVHLQFDYFVVWVSTHVNNDFCAKKQIDLKTFEYVKIRKSIDLATLYLHCQNHLCFMDKAVLSSPFTSHHHPF